MLINRPARIAILLGLSLLAGACSGPASPTPSATSSADGSPGEPGASASFRLPTSAPTGPSAGPGGTTVPSTPAPSASVAETCAMHTLDQLNEGQRVGQLFLLGLANDKLGPAEITAIETDHFGSVWFTATSHAGTGAIRLVADAVQALKRPRPPGPARPGSVLRGGQPGRWPGPGAPGRGLHGHPERARPGCPAVGKAESRSAAWGAQLAGGRSQPQLRPGNRRRARRRPPPRTSRSASSGASTATPRDGRPPRDGVHGGHDRGRHHDRGQAFSRASGGSSATRTSRPTWSTR